VGKFYEEVKAAFPTVGLGNPVPTAEPVGKKTMQGGDTAVLVENGKTVTVGQALTEIDRSIDQIPLMLQKSYLPLKQEGGPLAASFQRFLMVITEDSPHFRNELEQRVKAKAGGDWDIVVVALCTEDINTSPSYRAILIGNEGDTGQRVKVRALAVEYSNPQTSEKRKVLIGREIAEMTWRNLLSSPLAVVVESGIGMNIDASGKNSLAQGAGGSRVNVANLAWEAIKGNDELHSPLIPQVDLCSKLLAQSVGIDAIASTMVTCAAQASEKNDGDYFYPLIEVQLKESRKNSKKCDQINREIHGNEKAWAPIKPEATFITPNPSIELRQSMLNSVNERHEGASSSSSSKFTTKK
jgi:hypothetical protein